MRRFILAPAILAIMTLAALAAAGDRVQARLQGEGIDGNVTMTETESGEVLVSVSATGVPQGNHGLHVHETGSCDAAQGFKSAGGHFSGGKDHGIKAESGPHAGDLPNVFVGQDGVLQVEFFTDGFKLGGGDSASLLDDDGAAIVIHASSDDYQSQPSGDAGDRIACGILEPVGN